MSRENLTKGAGNRKLILAADVLAEAGRRLLGARDDFDTIFFPNLIGRSEFGELLRSERPPACVILGPTPFGAPEIAASAGIRVVSRIGVGFDAIDVPALTRHRIPLMITTEANAISVAEHTLSSIFALAKRTATLDALTRNQGWKDRMNTLPADLSETVILIVGFGRIGSRVAKLCRAFQMRVLVYDPYAVAASVRAAGAEWVSNLADAVRISDFVTLHCPKNPETTGLFGSELLACMRSTACLINTARGGIVDETALCDALGNGRIQAAAIDVFGSEPPNADNPLLLLKNVILSPHVAGVTKESVERMGKAAVRNVLSVFDGKPLRENIINPTVLG
ncbi:hydroxyacid dehydrogenase (plasmid) [Agrobacterium deltaense]|uniref:hydroxyacid dehydrogenase n=1 Tax=Agrobacterium deltaense TaxID=1183412 RepID=UPI003D9549B5